MSRSEPQVSPAKLQSLESFAHLPASQVAHLLQAGSLLHLKAKRKLAPDAGGESFYFLIDGVLSAVVAPDAKTKKGAKKSKSSNTAQAEKQAAQGACDRFVYQFSSGDLFSDAFLKAKPDKQTGRINLQALTKATLLRLDSAILEKVFRANPSWYEQLRRRYQLHTKHYERNRSAINQIARDFVLRHGLLNFQNLHVVSQDRCMECKACIKACAARHQHARLNLSDNHLGKLRLVAVCQQCIDPRCLEVCRKGAITRDEYSNKIKVNDKCNACGACAKACPAGAISFVGERKSLQVCDGCENFEQKACVEACPTQAMFICRPAELFGPAELGSNLARPFVDGVRVQKPTRQAGAWTLMIITTLVLAALGVECFVSRTMPEYSLSYKLFAGQGELMRFAPGAGLGHVLGYMGCGLMLLTLLYPLQSRLGWFSSISRTSFLWAHIWFGYCGAALATFHSILKLDRWVGLACVSMWLVLLSGLVGRTLYARQRTHRAQQQFRASAKPGRDVAKFRAGLLLSLYGTWRFVHIVLTIAMFVLSGVHIVYALMYKAM